MRSGVETKYKHVNFISFLTCKQCSIIINFSFRCQMNAYRYTCKMLSWSTFEISFLYVYKITNCDEGGPRMHFVKVSCSIISIRLNH